MPVESINLVVLRVANLDIAERFYSALGLHFSRHSHGTGPQHCAAELGATVFEIYPLGPKDIPTTSVRLGFSVTLIEAVIGAAESAGGRVVSSPKASEWGKRAVIADPFEHRIELIEVPTPA